MGRVAVETFNNKLHHIWKQLKSHMKRSDFTHEKIRRVKYEQNQGHKPKKNTQIWGHLCWKYKHSLDRLSADPQTQTKPTGAATKI